MMDIEERVFEIVSEQLCTNISKIKRESSFVSDLHADSLDVVELVMQFEDEFDIKKITDEEFNNVMTVGQAVNLIIKKKNEDKHN
jgi:acyl carrier protein